MGYSPPTINPENMKRLFVSIDLPDAVKRDLYAICYGLVRTKWVEEEQLHLTLRFIGGVDGSVFIDIKDSLENVRMNPFQLRLKGLGHFPPKKNPRVLWVGMEPQDSVTMLRNRIESILVKIGLEPERRKFSPHITIARLNDPPINKVARFLEERCLFSSTAFPVSGFCLYSSILTPKGAIHKVEVRYHLTVS